MTGTARGTIRIDYPEPGESAILAFPALKSAENTYVALVDPVKLLDDWAGFAHVTPPIPDPGRTLRSATSALDMYRAQEALQSGFPPFMPQLQAVPCDPARKYLFDLVPEDVALVRALVENGARTVPVCFMATRAERQHIHRALGGIVPPEDGTAWEEDLTISKNRIPAGFTVAMPLRNAARLVDRAAETAYGLEALIEQLESRPDSRTPGGKAFIEQQRCDLARYEPFKDLSYIVDRMLCAGSRGIAVKDVDGSDSMRRALSEGMAGVNDQLRSPNSEPWKLVERFDTTERRLEQKRGMVGPGETPTEAETHHDAEMLTWLVPLGRAILSIPYARRIAAAELSTTGQARLDWIARNPDATQLPAAAIPPARRAPPRGPRSPGG